MTIDRLEKDGYVEKVYTSEKKVNHSLELSRRDIKAAKDLLSKEDYDWALAVAYNAMLQAGRALMYSYGYRPAGDAKHISVVKFIETKAGEKIGEELMLTFDRLRKKRHNVVYDIPHSTSESEANRAVTNAKRFLKVITKLIKKS
jgi:uncharacterized protein (UPF0332 family)